jgi:pilus assembly protein FimV
MIKIIRPYFFAFTCLLLVGLANTAGAITLGSPLILSKSGDPLQVEFPIYLSKDEDADLTTLQASLSSQAFYQNFGISEKIYEFNPQVMVYRNRQQKLMILLETVVPVAKTGDPFLDVMINLKWSKGSITKTYTLLIGDTQKLLVKSGQTLSEIAAQMAPELNGATLDQAMLALFKANPDAFASGNINRLLAGAELDKPSQALLRSISPAEANQFVADAYAYAAQADGSAQGNSGQPLPNRSGSKSKDKLKIGSSIQGNIEERNRTEEVVAQERELEETKARIVELEKNISDLQLLINKPKEPSLLENDFGLGEFAPLVFSIILLLLLALAFWFLAKNARRNEKQTVFVKPSQYHSPPASKEPTVSGIPPRAKILLEEIDLELPKVSPSVAPAIAQESAPDIEVVHKPVFKEAIPESPVNNQSNQAPEISNKNSNPPTEVLRVKLNLARAFITIEDFLGAKKALQEILLATGHVDQGILLSAKKLLAELTSRQN